MGRSKNQGEHKVVGVLFRKSQIRKPPDQSGDQGVPLGYKHDNFPNQDPVEHP